MTNCLSTSEINNLFYFNVGLTEHSIVFSEKTVDFYIYRPITMASKNDLIIHIPGRKTHANHAFPL